MSHVVRTASSNKSAETRCWRVVLDDGSNTEPADMETLKRWAAEGRLTASCQLSQDEERWIQASLLPELEMDWLVLVSQEEVLGPFAFAALEVLRASGHIPAQAQVFRRQSAPSAGSQGMQLVQRAVAAETQRRESDAEAQRLRANLEARDLEFEAERQQFAAETSRMRADLLRRDSEIETLKAEAERMNAANQELEVLEARLVDTERELPRLEQAAAEAADLRATREKLQQEIETLRKEQLDANRETERIREILDRTTGHYRQQQDALRAFAAEHRTRLHEAFRSLDALGVDDVPEADPSTTPRTPPEPEPEPPSTAQPPLLASAEIRRIGPKTASPGKSAPPADVVVEVLPPERTKSRTPSQPAAGLNPQKLADLEAQAQQELARLKSAPAESKFWNRRKPSF